MSPSRKNGSEAKFYPNTSTSIEKYLMLAKVMHDNPHFAGVLTTATGNRLNAIEPAYKQARAQLGKCKAHRNQAVTEKAKARTALLLHVSHFLQVFMMGAKRGMYEETDRILFGMHMSTEKLPDLKGDSKLDMAGEQIVTGETKRIADGKPPMVNPSLAEVQAAHDAFMNCTVLAMNADDALFVVQKQLREMHKEARNVVKKVWREVETYHNEGDRERMRKHAREWGVHYARKGGEKTVTGTVTDATTGLPLGGAKVKFENGKNKTLSDIKGRFTLVTNLMKEQTLIATRAYYETAEVVVELKEGEENSCEVKMERGAV